MAVPYYGDFAEDATVYLPFNTFTSDDPAKSSTITELAAGDIKVHKNGSLTQIVTDGATVIINFDSITGNHLLTIDTSAHADYTTGAEYTVRIEGTVIDGATDMNMWIGAFSIERAGGVLALIKAGVTLAADAITDAKIANGAFLAEHFGANSLDGKGDWNTTTPPTVQAIEDEVWNALQSSHVGADSMGVIASEIAAIKAETVLIVADTGELQVDNYPTTIAALQTDLDTLTAGVTLAADAITDAKIADGAFLAEHFGASSLNGKGDWNTVVPRSASQIKTEVAAALVDIHLDHLLAADYDPATPPGIATALFNELVESNAGVSRYTSGALANAPSGGASAADVADAVWQEAQADHADAGSFGEIATEIAAIPTTAMRGTDAAATAANLGTVDTVVDAIKVVTDKFAFTVGNEVDANIKSINDAKVTGDGNATPWAGV